MCIRQKDKQQKLIPKENPRIIKVIDKDTKADLITEDNLSVYTGFYNSESESDNDYDGLGIWESSDEDL